MCLDTCPVWGKGDVLPVLGSEEGSSTLRSSHRHSSSISMHLALIPPLSFFKSPIQRSPHEPLTRFHLPPREDRLQERPTHVQFSESQLPSNIPQSWCTNQSPPLLQTVSPPILRPQGSETQREPNLSELRGEVPLERGVRVTDRSGRKDSVEFSYPLPKRCVRIKTGYRQ